MMDNNRDYILFSKALRHYSERLIQIQEEDEIKQGNDTLKENLNENSKNALRIAQELDEGKIRNLSPDDVEMIKSALQLYKKDLIASTQSLKKKLLDTDIPLKSVEKEINLITDNLDRRDYWN